MLEFRRSGESDILELRALAERIWRAYYPPIIGDAQVEYMLGQMYAPPTIEQEMRDGVVWILASVDGTPVGFLSISAEPNGHAKMNKLYLLPELHGRGYGAQMIDHAIQTAISLGAGELFLQV